MKIDIKEKTRK